MNDGQRGERGGQGGQGGFSGGPGGPKRRFGGQGRRGRSFDRRFPDARREDGPRRPMRGAPQGRPQGGGEEAPSTDFVYGRRPVFEAFEGKRTIHKLWIVQGTRGGNVEEIIQRAKDRGVPIEWTQWDWLDKKVRAHHQGIAAQVSAIAYGELEDFLANLGPTEGALVLALDEIQDPQNLGAMLRSAAFFGVSAAVAPRWRSAPVGEAAMRASSGAAEHVPMLRVRNLSDALLQMKEAGFEIVGTDMAAQPVSEFKRPYRTVLVMGSEGEGLRRLVKERCDKLVGIPRKSKLDSLNVAAAAAIFLYEFTKTRA